MGYPIISTTNSRLNKLEDEQEKAPPERGFLETPGAGDV